MTETSEYQKAAAIIAKRMAEKVGERVDEIDQDYVQHLEGLRYERFVREELADMTPDEQAAYLRENSPLAQVSRMGEAAIQEADAKWWQSVKDAQDKEYQEWQQANPTAAQSSRDTYKFFQEQADRANAAYQARLAARERRQLEAERHREDLARLWSSLDESEQAILRRMVEEDGTELDRIRRWKRANRNPIAHIDDRNTLGRLATERPKRQEYIPPTSEIENIDKAGTLYKMAARDMRKGRK
jgi:hypothetical protein